MPKCLNLIDIPVSGGCEDLLGMNKYINALVKFISVAQLPTTLAIQGEWGSGKTSLMNQIRYQLCVSPENKKGCYYGIWINTWHYSLLKDEETIVLSIIDGLTSEVVKIAKQKNSVFVNESLSKLGCSLRSVVKVGAKVAASSVGISSSIVDDLLTDKHSGPDLFSFRKDLEMSIQKCLAEDEKNGNKINGFLFFIDDLDRIDPPLAVKILEILKNMFEVDKCLFILAIDYDVVVKGLIPKFGEMTDKNEREFKSFFDKIVQLPFTMPTNAYAIEGYVSEGLKNIGFLSNEELEAQIVINSDDEVTELVKGVVRNLVKLSTGTNPRLIKRLINTLSLIKIITSSCESDDNKETVNEKVIFLALICIQISYPQIYSLLYKEPNFLEWDENFAQNCRLKQIQKDILEQISAREEFDEEWEQVIYRVAIGNDFLMNRVFRISTLMNLIRELCPVDLDLGDTIRKYIGLASVTSIRQDDGSEIAPNKRARIRYDSSESVYENLRTWGRSERIIDISKAIINDFECIFGDSIKIINAAGSIAVECMYPLGRSRLIIKMWYPKRYVVVVSNHSKFIIDTLETYNIEKEKIRRHVIDFYNSLTRPEYKINHQKCIYDSVLTE